MVRYPKIISSKRLFRSRIALAAATAGLLVFAAAAYSAWAPLYALFLGAPLYVVNVQAISMLTISLMMGGLILALYRRDRSLELTNELEGLRTSSFDPDQWLTTSTAIVSVTDPDGFFLCVNRNFEDVFGYSNGEVVGQRAHILYEDDRHDPMFTEVHGAVRLGDTWSGEQRLRARDGTLVLVQGTVFPVFDNQGRHLKTISIRTDVTNKRTAEAEGNMTALLRKLQDEVYIYRTEDLRVAFVNDLALSRSGLTRDEALNTKAHELIEDLTPAALEQHTQPLLTGEKSLTMMLLTSGEAEYEVVTRIHRGLDEVPVFVSVVRDISERRSVDQARLASVSIVSHELRTPLTSIKGSLRLIMSGAAGTLSKQLQDLIEIADRNSERLLSVVNDILDFEKLQAGRMELQFQQLDLVGFIRSAIDQIDGFASGHGVRLDFQNSVPEAWVKADENRLMQVLMNLVSNAVKFSPEDGIVRLGLEREGACWRVSVSDEGPGISEENHLRVFESFSQIDPADGKRRVGTGLGLAISKRITVEHGGRIDFDSEPGRGSNFFFEIPACNDAGEPLQPDEQLRIETAAE